MNTMEPRTNIWLAGRLRHLREQHFADIPIENTILVRFGRSSKTRFGSIIAKKRSGFTKPVTYININALFRDQEVPDFVIDATLAHEFVHYSHGFHSPLEQRYKFPHKGDIVGKELRQRGLGELIKRQEAWIKHEYRNFLRKNRML